MNTSKPLFRFTAILLLLLGMAFALHVSLLRANDLPMWDNALVLSYVTNAVLALLIFFLLYRFRIRLGNQIGFLFMAGSFLKFVVFFMVFYPLYTEDGNITRLEFAAFFVPYLICLVVETYFTAKMLNNMGK